MVVEKDIGGKPIFLRYLPAGSYFGEMAVLSGEKRNATVKAAVGSEVIKLPGAGFRAMLAARPQVRDATEAAVAERAQMNSVIHSCKASYPSAELGRVSCREGVWQYVYFSGAAVGLKKKQH